MATEIGKITEISGQEMTVQLRTGKQCNICAAKSACSFNGPDANYRYIRLPLQPGAHPGKGVELEYREVSRIWAALIVFCLPVLMLFAGYAVGNSYFGSSNSGIEGAVIGLILSAPVLWILNKLLAHSRFFRPQVSNASNIIFRGGSYV
ncbi:MAG: SoxR reducing system RseC family protein [Calditrichia bacterium]